MEESLNTESKILPKLERQKLAEDLSAFFDSDEGLNYLKGFDVLQRSGVIGRILEYGAIHKDLYGFEEYLKTLRRLNPDNSTDLSAAISDSIAHKLGIPGSGDLDSQRIYDYYFKAVMQNGFVYHSFNGVFEQAIRSSGLSAEDRIWDWQKLEKIHQIGEKAGRRMLLGWGMINSGSKIFFDTNPVRSAYRYAVASPEWFAQFTSEGYHVRDPERKRSFYRRDYDRARQNVLDLCDEMQSSKPEDIATRKAYPNITNEERAFIVEFFEHYWKLFAGDNSHPRVALIDRSVMGIPSDFSFDEACKLFLKRDPNNATAEEIIYELMVYDSRHVDVSISQDIPPENFVVVNLPDYSKIYPEQDSGI